MQITNLLNGNATTRLPNRFFWADGSVVERTPDPLLDDVRTFQRFSPLLSFLALRNSFRYESYSKPIILFMTNHQLQEQKINEVDEQQKA